MSVLYHPGKANVVLDALSCVSKGSVAHVEEHKKDLVCDGHTNWVFGWLTSPEVMLWLTMVQNHSLCQK